MSHTTELCRDGKFYSRPQRFATSEEATAYAEKLADASCVISDYRVGSSTDKVTHTFAAGVLRAVAGAELEPA